MKQFLFFILESTVSQLLKVLPGKITPDNIYLVFKKIMNSEIREAIKSMHRLDAEQVYNPEFYLIRGTEDTKDIGIETDNCFFEDKTVNRLEREKKKFFKAFKQNSPVNRNYSIESIQIYVNPSIEFDEFWAQILEKQLNDEVERHYKVRKRWILFVFILGFAVISFFGAAFIGSYKALLAKDITYAIAVKRLLSKTPVIIPADTAQPQYLTLDIYNTKEQLLEENPGSFIIIPPYIPEGYHAIEYTYMTHGDGYTTSIRYSITDFAHFSVQYAVRNEYDPFSYRIKYYRYEIIQEDGTSYYLFKTDNYGFIASFFLDDIYVTIKGQINYRGTDKANITKMVSGIIHEYYDTVTE